MKFNGFQALVLVESMPLQDFWRVACFAWIPGIGPGRKHARQGWVVGGGGGGRRKKMSSRVRSSDFQISRLADFQYPFFLSWNYFRKICWWDIEEWIITVSWRDPGQNWWFRRPFLLHWNSNISEKLTFWCHVRPNRVKICVCVFVRSVRSPWTPLDPLNSI